jgi:diacylglycerol kinase (ATP)
LNRIWRATINSWNGIVAAAQSDLAIRQELVLLALSIPLSLFLTPDFGKRLALVGSLIFVMIVELLNTAIEKIGDRITGEQDIAIGRIKDMGSAAVGLSLLLAGAVWLWIVVERFWP